MRLSDEIQRFIASSVMIIIGTRDADNRPAIGRAVGARITGQDTLEALVSAWQWPETVANLAANGQTAMTFARPTDYVSYQLKGVADLYAAAAADQALCRDYCSGMVRLFDGLGVAQVLAAPWLSDRELRVVRLSVREVYVQTPGSKAGTTVEGHAT